jgi:hypothetical protein
MRRFGVFSVALPFFVCVEILRRTAGNARIRSRGFAGEEALRSQAKIIEQIDENTMVSWDFFWQLLP